MDLDPNEKRLAMMAAAVVIISLIAIISFILGLNGTIFTVITVLALALGFYFAYHVSREQQTVIEQKQKSRKA